MAIKFSRFLVNFPIIPHKSFVAQDFVGEGARTSIDDITHSADSEIISIDHERFYRIIASWL